MVTTTRKKKEVTKERLVTRAVQITGSLSIGLHEGHEGATVVPAGKGVLAVQVGCRAFQFTGPEAMDYATTLRRAATAARESRTYDPKKKTAKNGGTYRAAVLAADTAHVLIDSSQGRRHITPLQADALADALDEMAAMLLRTDAANTAPPTPVEVDTARLAAYTANADEAVRRAAATLAELEAAREAVGAGEVEDTLTAAERVFGVEVNPNNVQMGAVNIPPVGKDELNLRLRPSTGYLTLDAVGTSYTMDYGDGARLAMLLRTAVRRVGMGLTYDPPVLYLVSHGGNCRVEVVEGGAVYLSLGTARREIEVTRAAALAEVLELEQALAQPFSLPRGVYNAVHAETRRARLEAAIATRQAELAAATRQAELAAATEQLEEARARLAEHLAQFPPAAPAQPDEAQAQGA